MKQSPLSLLKYTAALLMATVAVNNAEAQQLPLYSQYYINPMVYNPAATGTGRDWNAYAMHRDQWAGFQGAPVTNTLTIDGPVKAKKIGLGLNVYNDAIGTTSKTGAYLNYSYQVAFNKDNHLYLGLATGFVANQIDFSKQKLRDNTEATNPDLINTQTTFDASFGMIYEFKALQVGFSMPQLVGNSLTYTGQTENEKSIYTLSRHYLGTIKYVFDIKKDKGITAYPLVMLRASQGAPLAYDVNAVLDWKNTGWVAAGYKNSGAITVNAGIRFYGFSLGYAYDIANGPVGTVAGSTSEILLGYSFRVGGGEGVSGKRDRGELDKTVIALTERVKQLTANSDEDKKSIDSLKTLISKMNRADFNKNMDPEMGVVYRLKTINYGVKSSELDKKDRKVLDDVVEFLENNPNIKIDIQSHTDDMGEADNNYKLSEQRAKVVYDYLVEKGIDEGRLSYKAFGESMPLELGSDPKTREKNRRTEFIIISKFYSEESK